MEKFNEKTEECKKLVFELLEERQLTELLEDHDFEEVYLDHAGRFSNLYKLALFIVDSFLTSKNNIIHGFAL